MKSKKNKLPLKNKQILIGSAIVALSIVAWYIITLVNFNNESERLDLLVEEINSPQSKFIEGDSYSNSIEYSTLVKYNDVYRSNNPVIKDIQNRLNGSSGVSFWFSSKRDKAILEIDDFLKFNDDLILKTAQVTDNLANIQSDVVKQLGTNKRARETARNTFKKESDEADFLSQKDEMNKMSKLTSSLKSNVMNLKNIDKLEGLAEEIRGSVLNQFKSNLDLEKNMLNSRFERLNNANKSLRSYKKKVRKSVSTNYGVFSTFNDISKRMHPIVSTINNEAKPVRDILSNMEKPMGGSQGSNISSIGSFLGTSNYTKYANYSTIDLIKKVDPVTGKSIETLNTIIKELVKLESEINTIISTTEPFLSSVKEFQNSRSRMDMINLIESGPALKNYILSKQNLFSSLIGELDEVSASISKIEHIASDPIVRHYPKAKRYIRQLSGHARNILNVCYYPFKKWEEVVTSTAQPVGNLAAMEKSYMDFLNNLVKKDSKIESVLNPSFTVSETQVKENSSETTTSTSSSASVTTNTVRIIKSKLEAYYSLLDDENLDAILPYYTFPVKKWFADENVSPIRLVENSRNYYRKWPYHSTKVDWSSLLVSKLNNGYYSIRYNMDYWVKKRQTDPYKYYYLKIRVVMTPQFKINELDEKIVNSKTVSSIAA